MTPRRNVLIAVAVVVVIAVAAVAFYLGTRVKSPAQAAATASAPKPTALTAPVEQRVLTVSSVFRGDVAPADPIQVTMPTLPSGSQPVVTAVGKKPGQEVNGGDLLGAVAGRPIFVLPGNVPAYRTMSEGESGVDVRELQLGLRELGYGTGGDGTGEFGAGTSAAVRRFYRNAGYAPIGETAPAATAPDALTGGSGATPTGSAPPEKTWTVPLGEVVFVPTLPARVVASSLNLGSALGGGSATSPAPPSSGGQSTSVLTLSSGDMVVTGQVAAADAKLLRPGMKATFSDDATGGQWKGVVFAVGGAATQSPGSSNAVPQTAVTLVASPADAIPASGNGQNIRVEVTRSSTGTKVLVVPVAAVFAHADGRSYVTVVSGTTRRGVTVAVGVNANGYVQVTPKSGSLAPGDAVLVGSAPAGTGGS